MDLSQYFFLVKMYFFFSILLYHPTNIHNNRWRDPSLPMTKGNHLNLVLINVNLALILFPLEVLLTGLNLGILVRDNDVRKALKQKWGAKCIIM